MDDDARASYGWNGWSGRPRPRQRIPAVSRGGAPRRPPTVDIPGRHVGSAIGAARTGHPVPDGLDHQDVHRRARDAVPRRRAARPRRPDLGAPAGAGARRADHPAAAVAHRRACSGSRTATSGTRCGCPTPSRLLADLARAERVLPTARRFHYSNLGCRVLGHLVGRLRGGTWAEVLADRILAPLGLTGISTEPGEQAAVGYLVDAYSDHARPEPRDRLRRRSRPPASCGRPRRIWPAGRRSWPIRPQWTRRLGSSPPPQWRRCAGRAR